MTKAPEPEDKLDAATAVVVNGLEDAPFDWHAIDWRRVEDDVRRLRQRIFTASKAGDLEKVRSLQKLMLRSRANTLLSVRRVTERNAGRMTAGVDGEVVLTPEAKPRLADRVHQQAEPFKALPVRRVYIPKRGSSTKRRPLGIPVIADRCHQARVVNALEPEWEARFEPRSYVFRPGRGCHDAIQAVFEVVKGKSPKRPWVLDADLAGAFDRIAHDHILAMLGTFPARVRYQSKGSIRVDSPAVIRYADDFIVHCHTRQDALEIKAKLAEWLASRGLAFNEDKTRVVTLAEGFDFLGFNVRRYRDKTLIKPSKAAIRRIRERLRTELRSLRGSNAQAVIKTLNPIIRGWANYYRTQVSSEAYSALDAYLWRLTWKWANYSHPNKPKPWVFARYYGKFNKSRQDRWVFGDRHSGAYMTKFAWTHILRHWTVKHRASPDDPTLADYWTWRRRKALLPINKTTQELTNSQDGRCAICKGALFPAENQPQTPSDWEKWLATRTAIITTATRPGRSETAGTRLIHAECRNGLGPELRDPYEAKGLA